ncbi:MAG: class B sortase [Lachnospiraceae bacterium]|nr:class B sortase [Lachnospiraceae bacterium]
MDRHKQLYLLSLVLTVSLLIFVSAWMLDWGNSPTVGNRSSKASADSGIDGEFVTGGGITVTRSVELIEAENRELLEVYKNMKEDNPDFAGFIRITGTAVEYPVMYTPYEPEKYIHMDINCADSEDGLPFIDARCSIDPDSDNIIIYGHNMKDGSMFASLISYQNKAYYDEHPVIRYDTADEIREYEIMSVFYDRVYYTDETDVFKFYNFIDASDEADFDRNVSQYLKKSVYDTGVTAHYGDKLITLVTCAYHTENGRFVVIAKRKQNTE